MQTEAWVFHICADDTGKSAVWAAQRCAHHLYRRVYHGVACLTLRSVPDDHIAVVSNGFIIRQMDLNNRDYFMASENIHDVAIRAKLWDPATGQLLLCFAAIPLTLFRTGPFDFSLAYAMQQTIYHETYISRCVVAITNSRQS